MKFTRIDTPTIMDGMVVRYKIGNFEINASRNGVSTNGSMPLIRDIEDLREIVEYLQRALSQYNTLKDGENIFERKYPIPESAFEPKAKPEPQTDGR